MKKLVIEIALLFFLCSCASAANVDKELEPKYDKAFEAFNLTGFALEYPPNQRILDICIKNNEQDCLIPYNRVQVAKEFFQDAIDRDESIVLNKTLSKILYDCSWERGKGEFACNGAVISLYFFNKQGQQQQIMDAVGNAPGETIQQFFFTRYEWMYNRPNPDQWIRFVNSLPNHKLPPNSKKMIIREFQRSKKAFEKFGLML